MPRSKNRAFEVNSVRRDGINSAHMKTVFTDLVDRLENDALFGAPSSVRRAIEQHTSGVAVVILGTKAMGSELICALGSLVVAVVDDFLLEKENSYCGVPIISTTMFVEMARNKKNIVAINTCRRDKPKRFFDRVCRANDIPHANFEEAVRAFGLQGRIDFPMDDWGQHILGKSKEYQALAERLEDDYSVQTLFGILNFQLACDPEYFHHIERPYSTLYFRSGLFQFSQEERFIDCGASVGESLSGLIDVTKGVFEKAWLIEPDLINCNALQQQVDQLRGEGLASKVSLHQCAVGEISEKLPFYHSGGHGNSLDAASALGEGAGFVDVVSIDELIDDVPTFIKMDIEGFELLALKGARRAIEASRPKMAISAYHRATDILDITSYVLSLNPDYRVGLRHHTSDRWDTCLYFY